MVGLICLLLCFWYSRKWASVMAFTRKSEAKSFSTGLKIRFSRAAVATELFAIFQLKYSSAALLSGHLPISAGAHFYFYLLLLFLGVFQRFYVLPRLFRSVP